MRFLAVLLCFVVMLACGDEGIESPIVVANSFYNNGTALSTETVINNPLLPHTLLSPLAEKVLMSTVYLIAETDKGRFQGSGFVCRQGLIATASHITGHSIPNLLWVQSMLNDQYYSTDAVYAHDIENDLIIFSVPNFPSPPLTLTDSDNVYIGQVIAAAGAPRGLKGSFSTGVVSGLRANANQDFRHDVIQITAPLANGSSGGPVVNLRGEVVGIVSFHIGMYGLEFATPANALTELLEETATATSPPTAPTD